VPELDAAPAGRAGQHSWWAQSACPEMRRIDREVVMAPLHFVLTIVAEAHHLTSTSP
jgi:hypothetical protein